MSSDDQRKEQKENLQSSIQRVTKTWPAIKKDLGLIREEIAHEYFQKYPRRHQLFENAASSTSVPSEALLDRKLLKHSTAVINFLEAVVDFVSGNEESKPMYFLLGRHHKRLSVNEKMFLEMKDAISDIIKRRFTPKDGESWETVIEYIYINYVFPGMLMWKEGSITRLYSSYAEYFKTPVTDKESIENTIKEHNKEELLAAKFRATPVSQTCLANYDPDLEKFTKYIMRKGKLQLARNLLEQSFTHIKHIQLRKYHSEKDPEKQKNIILNPREIFSLAVRNTTPLFSVVKIRKSGSWYKVPSGISAEDAKKVAMKWIVNVSKDKVSKITFPQALAQELISASVYEGKAIAKKIELHKLCESNRSYLHYWWA